MITTHPECVHEVQFFGTFFSKKKDFLFFGSGQQLTLYACAGVIACASQQIGESSKLCREGRKQSQAEHACVIFGQLFFFVFVEKCMFSYIRMFSFWHKKQTLNVNPSPVLVIILHPRTHQYIIHPHKYTLADDGSFWNAGTHPKTFKTLKVK